MVIIRIVNVRIHLVQYNIADPSEQVWYILYQKIPNRISLNFELYIWYTQYEFENSF